MEELAARIGSDPRFHALQKARSRLVWLLVAIVAGCFYGYLCGIAYFPEWFAQPLPLAAPLTLSIAYGAGLIVLCIVVTGIYVYRANREFDRINQQIIADAAEKTCE